MTDANAAHVNAPQQLFVVDCGKRGQEHFEFNRGIFRSLARRVINFRFFGMKDMYEQHAVHISDGRHGVFSWPRLFAHGGRATMPLKLLSLLVVLRAMLAGGNDLLVLYSTPISHLCLSLLSHLSRRKMVVFLHAEIEFLAQTGLERWRVGPWLMLSALRLASHRVTYLTLTEAAAVAVRSCRRTGQTSFCPHPVSPKTLNATCRPKTLDPLQRLRSALMFFRPNAELDWLRDIGPVTRDHHIGIVLNGSVCVAPSAQDVFGTINELRSCRSYLTREQFEDQFWSCGFYIVGAGPSDYKLTASGPACVAASTGAVVFGCENRFMCEYAALYPSHFRLGQPTTTDLLHLAASASAPLDNLEEVASALDAAMGRTKTLRE